MYVPLDDLRPQQVTCLRSIFWQIEWDRSEIHHVVGVTDTERLGVIGALL